MRTHELKIQKQFLDAVLSGEKPFEVRKNDRGFQKGDQVLFKELTTETDSLWPKFGRYATADITYVLSGWGIEIGYVVFGIANVEEVSQEEPQ